MRTRLLSLLIGAVVIFLTYWLSTIGAVIWIYKFSTTCGWCDALIASVVVNPRPSLLPIGSDRTRIVFVAICIALTVGYAIISRVCLGATFGELVVRRDGLRGRMGGGLWFVFLLLLFATFVQVWGIMFEVA